MNVLQIPEHRARGLDRQKHCCGVVIPVYNAFEHLDCLLLEISKIQTKLNWRLSVLLVDDGSRPPLPAYRLSGLEIRQLRHRRNLGKGAALRSGFTHHLAEKRNSAVLTLDGDLQHPAAYIPQFLRQFQEGGGDIIIGCRRLDPRKMPVHRLLSNFLTSRLISLMIGQQVKDSQCGYRLYSRRALTTVRLSENRFHLESEFLIRGGWSGLRINQVDIPTIYNGSPSAIRNLPDTWNFITLIWRLLKERMSGDV